MHLLLVRHNERWYCRKSQDDNDGYLDRCGDNIEGASCLGQLSTRAAIVIQLSTQVLASTAPDDSFAFDC
jgi:hypothetical protein